MADGPRWDETDHDTTPLEDIKAVIKILTESRGAPPNLIVMSGHGLNVLCGTDRFDPGKAYWVTEEGIAEMREGE